MRVCNEGFEQEFIDGKSDMYAIAFTQNVFLGVGNILSYGT